jgi:SAM-dependent methyltransferase
MSKVNFILQDEECLNCGCKRLLRFKARAFDAATPSDVNIIECARCGFAWQYPLGRSSEESVKFFEKSYKGQGRTGSDYFKPARKVEISKLQLQFLEKVVRSKGAILDIGAGGGIFAVTAAENGWVVTAIDPALEISAVTDKKNVTFIKGTLKDLPDQELFDVITMWDIIEHVENPLELILSAQKFLKPGGWLILETGNYKSAERVENGLSGWIYQLDHKWYFSPDSISNLFLKLGFSEMIFADRVLRPNWDGLGGSFGAPILELIKSIIKEPFQMKLYIQKYFKLRQAVSWTMSGVSIFAVAAHVD